MSPNDLNVKLDADMPQLKILDPELLDYIQRRRVEDVAFAAGARIMTEGDPDPPLYTVASGWAMRFKMLKDGRRQILSFVLPGDVIGFQAQFFDRAVTSIEAITDISLCVVPYQDIAGLYQDQPEIAFRFAALTADQKRVMEEQLLSLGQRTALERVAALILDLYGRAEARDMVRNDGMPFPLTQQHVADALGISLVHANRTLKQLQRDGLFRIKGRRLQLLDAAALERVAQKPAAA
ncbi:Crp/Fnr family transcriptional regulator [Inquilinus sp. Marseille-Q2685]|uniref:Crp/Fnr family transcriptional regulator n=1 Tax=Inquilinus sp. Marseille-Q2685 TaxID=2866581 RepID=UPI001CE48A0B|nr:Crp/Fnr family transcriptional regulator [Inquilinus sp. Marseille-Q2685]